MKSLPKKSEDMCLVVSDGLVWRFGIQFAVNEMHTKIPSLFHKLSDSARLTR